MFQFKNSCGIEMMRSLPDQSIDLLLTDPPYKVTSRGGYTSSGGMLRDEKFRSGVVFETPHISEWIDEAYRVLKDGSHAYIMCNNKNLPEFLAVVSNSDFHFVKSLIWLKDNKIMSQMYMSQFEYVLFLRKGKAKKVNDCGISDVLQFKNPKPKQHPTEKPILMLELLIQQSTQDGDVVLDPFAGVCTTGSACIKTNRSFIGCEIDQSYFAIGESRNMECD